MKQTGRHLMQDDGLILKLGTRHVDKQGVPYWLVIEYSHTDPAKASEIAAHELREYIIAEAEIEALPMVYLVQVNAWRYAR